MSDTYRPRATTRDLVEQKIARGWTAERIAAALHLPLVKVEAVIDEQNVRCRS